MHVDVVSSIFCYQNKDYKLEKPKQANAEKNLPTVAIV